MWEFESQSEGERILQPYRGIDSIDSVGTESILSDRGVASPQFISLKKI